MLHAVYLKKSDSELPEILAEFLVKELPRLDTEKEHSDFNHGSTPELSLQYSRVPRKSCGQFQRLWM